MDGLVFAVFVPSVESVAVIVVVLLTVLSVTLKVWVPLTNAAFAGNVAAPSLEVMAIVCVLLTGFQLASTALTVTLNATPVISAPGVPVFPLTVPGAALSPGTSNCNFENTPALTVRLELAVPAIVPSVAVIVGDSAFVNVTLTVPTPEAKLTLEDEGEIELPVEVLKLIVCDPV